MLLGQCRASCAARHPPRDRCRHRRIGPAGGRGGDPHVAALASGLAGEVYGLEVLARDIEDEGNNTTRFLVMSRRPDFPPGR